MESIPLTPDATEALRQLRHLFRIARATGPTWGEDTSRRRPAVAVASLLAVLASSGEWLLFARVVAAFRRLCGERFARRVHELAAARVSEPRPGLAKTSTRGARAA